MSKNKRMTWKDLKSKIDELSDEQLEGEVCFQDNYDNLMDLNLYINDERPMDNEEWGTHVGAKMPYFGY